MALIPTGPNHSPQRQSAKKPASATPKAASQPVTPPTATPTNAPDPIGVVIPPKAKQKTTSAPSILLAGILGICAAFAFAEYKRRQAVPPIPTPIGAWEVPEHPAIPVATRAKQPTAHEVQEALEIAGDQLLRRIGAADPIAQQLAEYRLLYGDQRFWQLLPTLLRDAGSKPLPAELDRERQALLEQWQQAQRVRLAE